MHSKSDNIEIVIYDKVDEAIKETFQSLLNRYQHALETSIEVVILSLIVIIYCIKSSTKYVGNVVENI